ncbi:hypothetical protein GARC_1579 [Paraglaciecola arctica BSs20135]|uniref:Uncharacterized protein n=1 Tax=Paraglaciecola arctica BSs20135 TaxID=493475 RepID=K6Y3K9_9ALTE|nr:hypothetical protein GARC_1579 [Paraglaciecola arctica BSs20135]
MAFTRFLTANGWDVEALSASLKAFDKWSSGQVMFILDNITVQANF